MSARATFPLNAGDTTDPSIVYVVAAHPLSPIEQRARDAIKHSVDTNAPEDMDVAMDACLEAGWTHAADILRIRACRRRETLTFIAMGKAIRVRHP